MARICSVCGKGVMTGNSVSHSHRKTKKRFKPNLQRTKVNEGGTVKHILICSSCRRAGKVAKAV